MRGASQTETVKNWEQSQLTEETAAEAHKVFQAAREKLLAYSRRLGLVASDATDRDTPAPDLAFTVDTAEELLRLDAKVKEAWAVYQEAQEEGLEQQCS